MTPRAPVWALAALAAAAGCGQRGAKRIARDRDAAAVVVTDHGPAAIDLTDEQEPNDAADKAGALALPGGVRGVLDGSADVDVYRVQVTAAGMLAVSLGGIEGVDLVLELRDPGGKSLAKSDRGPAKTSEGIPNYPVQAGAYTVWVTEFVKPVRKPRKAKIDAAPAGRVGPSAPYRLDAAMVTPAEGDEREPNDEGTYAQELLLDDEGLGYVGWKGDLDYWKVPLEGFTPSYALQVDADGLPGVALTVEVRDEGDQRLAARTGARGDGVTVANLVTRQGSPQYFVIVRGDRPNPVDRYALRVRSRELAVDDEVEPNDDPSKAGPLAVDPAVTTGVRRGQLDAGDVDLFMTDEGAVARRIELSVEPPADLDVELAVLIGGQPVAAATAAGKGGVERLSALLPAGAKAAVRVSGKGAGTYTLRWALLAEEPAPEPSHRDDAADAGIPLPPEE